MASKHGWAKMRTHNKGEAVMGRWRSVVALGVGVVLLAAGGWAIAEVKVDAGLQAYKATAGVSGNISSVGSSTAPPALIAGTAQLGPMSRSMKGTEVDKFEKKFGYKPTPIRTSVDALAVFVNKDNPVKCMTLAQVDAVFSKSRRQGARADVTTWGQLGLTGAWASKPISLYGPNSASP